MGKIRNIEDAINDSLAPLDEADPTKFMMAARLLGFGHKVPEVAQALDVEQEALRDLLAMSNAFRELVDRYHDAWVREKMVDVRNVLDQALERGEMETGQDKMISNFMKLFKEARLEQREEKRAVRGTTRVETNTQAPIIVEVDAINEN